ncbi:MAG TPA: 50S ribosomal protein L25 [Sumerlaeia bacterium]|nr:50S ribosomal protein L25 [Sumerlaeia bacterium]
MERTSLHAKIRTGSGKGANRRHRASGQIPAVLYGQGKTPTMLLVDEQGFRRATAKMGDEMVLFDLAVDGADIQRQIAVIREAQRDPVTERVIHLDFLRVDMARPLDIDIAVHEKGVPVGLEDGGVLEQVVRVVRLRCLPDRIPSHLEVDVSGLRVNDAIHVGELAFEEGLEILSPPSDVVFHVIPPRKVEEVKEEAAAGAEEIAAEAPEEGGKPTEERTEGA